MTLSADVMLSIAPEACICPTTSQQHNTHPTKKKTKTTKHNNDENKTSTTLLVPGPRCNATTPTRVASGAHHRAWGGTHHPEDQGFCDTVVLGRGERARIRRGLWRSRSQRRKRLVDRGTAHGQEGRRRSQRRRHATGGGSQTKNHPTRPRPTPPHPTEHTQWETFAKE